MAIQAIKNGKYPSAAAAARSFEIPVSTLKARINGRESATEKRHNRFIFTEIEEGSIEKWLLDMDSRGAALTLPMLRDMANLLLMPEKLHPLLWVIIGPLNLSNDAQISLLASLANTIIRELFQKTLEFIESWFDLVQRTIEKWGIASDDIFNFDESGFAMGIGATQKMITSAEYHGKRALLQAGNREWVTSIECIRASGSVLPPLFVFKGKNSQSIYDPISFQIKKGLV